jgi:cyclophilin family peptidyl-prolyl cis-trans isomerase
MNSRKMLARVAVVGVIAAVALSPLVAQAASQAVTRFEQTQAEWKAILADLAELQSLYQAADDRQRPALEERYQETVRRGQQIAARLRVDAEAAFAEAPDRADIRDLLHAMAASSLNSDDYEESLRLSELLLKHDPDNGDLMTMVATSAFAVGRFDDAEQHLRRRYQGEPTSDEGKDFLRTIQQYKAKWAREEQLRQAEAQADDLPRVKLQTTKGDLVIELFENEAPNTVANFISLVEKKFYDGTPFHRVLPGFMAQGGDPTGTGSGGPGYTIACECYQPNYRHHFRGSLSMAHRGRDTGGSQFFITFAPTGHLDGRHTVFGRVIEGLEVMARIQRINPDDRDRPAPDKILKATVLRKRDRDYVPKTSGS